MAVASALWLLAAGAAAQQTYRAPAERNADGGVSQPVMPAEQRVEQISSRDAPAPGGGRRLSPEERRQLRRDVHEAGRVLYRDRMPPGRREPRRQ